MDFQLTETAMTARDAARAFAERLKPLAGAWDEAEAIPDEFLREGGRLGFFGLLAPEEYGGLGLDALSYAVAMEELARANAGYQGCLSVHNSLVCTAVSRFGTPEQKSRYLPKLAAGELIGAYSLSEPGAGSDAGSISATGVSVGDDFKVDGEKCWVSNGGIAGLFTVFVSTSPASASRGISCFLIEKGTPGFTIGRKEKKMGLRASDTRAISFKDCRVPRSSLLGSLHGGFKIAMSLLDGGRVGIGAQAVGIAQAALDEAVAYAKARKQFGRSISEFQLIQAKIADMAVGVDAARLLVRRAAALLARGARCTKEASMAKLFATTAANRAVYDALQIHGGNGYVREFPVERYFRDARAGEIYEGTSEIQRLIIAREVLRGRAS
ncbi:MAG: acyl-CoA dehydrogenase [Elusimicrobia bacterium]|nr:acyl-CoA dehydrogenase [Elusimicrobiota bacterium]